MKGDLSPPERESRIAGLKTEIQQLEAIANRTTEQEQELKDKKKELTELEKQSQTEEGFSKKPTNYWPLILGGIAILSVLGIIIYFFTRKKEQE